LELHFHTDSPYSLIKLKDSFTLPLLGNKVVWYHCVRYSSPIITFHVIAGFYNTFQHKHHATKAHPCIFTFKGYAISISSVAAVWISDMKVASLYLSRSLKYMLIDLSKM
jgi:hypothetical protein